MSDSWVCRHAYYFILILLEEAAAKWFTIVVMPFVKTYTVRDFTVIIQETRFWFFLGSDISMDEEELGLSVNYAEANIDWYQSTGSI